MAGYSEVAPKSVRVAQDYLKNVFVVQSQTSNYVWLHLKNRTLRFHSLVNVSIKCLKKCFTVVTRISEEFSFCLCSVQVFIGEPLHTLICLHLRGQQLAAVLLCFAGMSNKDLSWVQRPLHQGKTRPIRIFLSFFFGHCIP